MRFVVSAVENRAWIQRVLSPLAEGDARPFVAALADDVTWTVTGENPWSGAYRGKTALRSELFGRVMPRFKQPYRLSIKTIVAEGAWVVVELRGVDNVTNAGVPYQQEYCWICRVAGEQLKEVREYADTYLASQVLEPALFAARIPAAAPA
jgi:ketosteroid isomerase-like protein